MNKQELASRIWESANTMRSKIEANEYKDYILGFIFYKFLSEKEEQFLLSNGMPREDFPAMLTEEDADTVRYVQDNVGYFISYDNLYSTWLARGNDFDVSNVRDGLNAFSRLIAEKDKALFRGIFNTLQTGLSKLGDSATSQTKAIRSLLALIQDIPMDGSQGYDVLGFIYEYLIEKFAANAGKKAGEFYTPHEVSLLMSRIVAHHLAGRSEIQIYDPTSGSGSLLLNIGQEVARHMGDPDRIKYYAQELKANTYNLTRMNLVMRGIKPDNIVARNADTLEQDWPMFDDEDPAGTYQALYVDAVVSNPPYSQKWDPTDKEADPRYSRFGLAPSSKADYAFLLHDLFHVKPDGVMTIVLPHGVLFRGGSEAVIRKELIEQNHIDAIIGLPANIFFGTGIPTIIMVLKQRRTRSDVLFIDASQGFQKVGKSNQLRACDIRRISDAIEQRTDIEGFARVVSRDELRANDYNLNIPRYVSATPHAENIDLYATIHGGIPETEISELVEYWDTLPGLRETLFSSLGNGYASLATTCPGEAIANHQSVETFNASVAEALNGLDELLISSLVHNRTHAHIAGSEEKITQEILNRFTALPLVDEYSAYQVLHDHWQTVATDLEMIQTEGEETIRQIAPVMVWKTKNKQKVEEQDGWDGRIIPFHLVQETLLADSLSALTSVSDALTSTDNELTAIIESLSEEQLDELKDVLTDKNDAFKKTELTKAVKELQKSSDTIAEDSIEGIQIHAKRLLDTKTKLAKEEKALALKLETATRQAIESLTGDQIESLLIAKWITPLCIKLHALPTTSLKALETQVKALATKYARPLAELDTQIRETENTLAGMLTKLTGSMTDMEALNTLHSLLGGNHE